MSIYPCYERLQPYQCAECHKEINGNDPGITIDIGDLDEFHLHEGCGSMLMNAIENFLVK